MEIIGREKNCRVCKFYFLEIETTVGWLEDEPLHPNAYESTCLRYPPVIVDASYYGSTDTMDVRSDCFSSPTVRAIAWCGEWLPRSRER